MAGYIFLALGLFGEATETQTEVQTRLKSTFCLTVPLQNIYIYYLYISFQVWINTHFNFPLKVAEITYWNSDEEHIIRTCRLLIIFDGVLPSDFWSALGCRCKNGKTDGKLSQFHHGKTERAFLSL